jgi:flavin reductase (DIM6/NTAB) family NADH-FMN oxidoreductase RutF
MAAEISKIDVKPEWWDNVFAPSSCLVMITTVDERGSVNAASFGTCVRVCHDPVYIAFTVGTHKDTANNVLSTRQFVVNVVPFEVAILNKVLVCGLPFKPGVNELEAAGLTAIPAKSVRPPRIAECRSHFECSVAWTQSWANRLMVCGKVEAVSIDPDCITANGFIVWDKVKPAHYCGGRYQDRFVPAYDKPTRAKWSYDGPVENLREDQDWRSAYQSTDET